MELIDDLVRIESLDAVVAGGLSLTWSGSDEARAAHAAVEARIQAVRHQCCMVGVDGEEILTLLVGDE